MVHAVDNTVRDQVVELAERVLSIVATMGRRGTEVTGSDSIVLCTDRCSGRTGAQLQPQPRRPPSAPTVLAGLKHQAHRRETTGDIKTGAAFDADRLQRNRLARATHQHVGADPDPYVGLCRSSERQAAYYQAERAYCHSKFAKHCVNLLLAKS